MRSILARVAAFTATFALVAIPASAADVPVGTDVAAMAERAVAGLTNVPHTAKLDLTTGSAFRSPDGTTNYASTGAISVRQKVASPRRSVGTMNVDKKNYRIVTFDGRVYVAGGRYTRMVWGTPNALELPSFMFSPADPLVRFPRAAQLANIAPVAGEPGAYVRLRSELSETAARAFVRTLGLGKSNAPADLQAAVDGARFERRTIDLVIDPLDGRLVTTTTDIQIALDLNLAVGADSTTKGDLVLTIASTFAPTKLDTKPLVQRPAGAISVAAFERLLFADDNAKSLLRNAASTLESAFITRQTYRVDVSELAKIDPNVKWLVKRAASSRLKQVEFVWASTDGYLLATKSPSGKVFTYERRQGKATVTRCTLKGRSCGTW